MGAQALIKASTVRLNHRRVVPFHIGEDVQAPSLEPAKVCPDWGQGGGLQELRSSSSSRAPAPAPGQRAAAEADLLQEQTDGGLANPGF